MGWLEHLRASWCRKQYTATVCASSPDTRCHTCASAMGRPSGSFGIESASSGMRPVRVMHSCPPTAWPELGHTCSGPAATGSQPLVQCNKTKANDAGSHNTCTWCVLIVGQYVHNTAPATQHHKPEEPVHTVLQQARRATACKLQPTTVCSTPAA